MLPVGHRSICLTNPDKPLYPRSGSTKQQVMDHYVAVAPYLLPHLKDRPVTLKRYPDDVTGQFFYEKDAPTVTPSWPYCPGGIVPSTCLRQPLREA